MEHRKVLAVLFALALQAVSASADSVTRTVGSESFDFVVPKGQCVLEESNPYDAKFINVVRTLFKGAKNTLIVATAECGRRATLRNGVTGNVLDYAAYYTPDSNVNSTVEGKTQSLRKSLCADMRKQSDATLENVTDIVAKKAKELRAKIAITSTSYIGVLDEDEHGCYAGLLIGVKGANKVILMSVIVTSTLSHAKPLFLAIYHEYNGPSTTTAGVQAAKATLAEFDKKNP
ncbi:MAG: hypothetical protein ACLPWS_16920 [Rhodomicrobium sp.]